MNLTLHGETIENVFEQDYIARRAVDLCNDALSKLKKELETIPYNKTFNLKLYDVAMLDELQFEKDGFTITVDSDRLREFFEDFCEIEYEYFEEFCYNEMEYYKDFRDISEYIGTTSSFYLSNLHSDNISDTLYESIGTDYEDITLTKDGQIDVQRCIKDYDDMYDPQDGLYRLISDLMDLAYDLTSGQNDMLNDIKLVADYIDSFKKNQVERFTEYVKAYFNDNVLV